MKILMVSPIVGDAFGQERVMRDSARLLEADGHQVYYIGEKCGPNVPLRSLLLKGLTQVNRFSSPRQLRQLENDVVDFASASAPDVVHFVEQFDPRIMNALSSRYPSVMTAHTVAPTCPASGRATAQGACELRSGWGCLVENREKKCLAHFRNDAYRAHAIYEFHRKRAATQRLNFVVATSAYTEQLLLNEGWKPSQVRRIYNPVFVPDQSVTRETSDTDPLLVTTSRLHPLKGLSTLLAVLGRLKKLPWQLVICGEGPERVSLEAQVRDGGLSDRVRFLGQVPYKKAGEWVEKASVLIQPNIGPETFGLSVAEASSLGIPVLTSNLPALNEIIEDGVNGLLCAPRDLETLTEKLSALLKNAGLRKQFSENGPVLMRKRFSPKAHLEDTLALYRACTQTVRVRAA